MAAMNDPVVSSNTTLGSNNDDEIQVLSLDIASIRAFAAEFVGTFLLAYTVACAHILFALLGADPSLMWLPTAVGGAVAGLVYLFGPVSLANLNPAISLAMGLCGKLSWPRVGIYIFIQIFAALLGNLACAGTFSIWAPLFPPDVGFSWLATLDIFFTALLAYVMLNCLTARRNNLEDDKNHFFGVATGFVVLAATQVAAPLCGASMNPALSLGIGASTPGQNLWQVAGYILFEVIGGCLGGALFVLSRPEDTKTASDGELALFRPQMWTRLVVEFFGTFSLVLTFGLALFVSPPEYKAVQWATGAVLVPLLYSTVNISGAHFNPAITLAVVLSGRNKVSVSSGLLYALVQTLGGMFAAIALAGYHSQYAPIRFTPYGVAPVAPHTWESAAFVEFLFTFVLAFIQLTVETTTMPASLTSMNFFFGLAIGLSFAVGGFLASSISGGFLNPSIAWGVAMEAAFSGWRATGQPLFANCLWYAFFQFFGGATASLLFRLTHIREYPFAKLSESLENWGA